MSKRTRAPVKEPVKIGRKHRRSFVESIWFWEANHDTEL